MHKFFADRDAISGNRIVLSGDDAHHISFSLRMKAGEHITVALPDGNDCFCTLESFAGGNVTRGHRFGKQIGIRAAGKNKAFSGSSQGG